MEIRITILKGERPPPVLTLITKDSLNSSIEAVIPEELKPGYVSNCRTWGLIWVVKGAKGIVLRSQRTRKKKKKK